VTDRRVVVTGVGTVNASTVGGRDALAAALGGRSAIGPIRAFDAADLTSRLGAEVDDDAVAALVDRDAARRLSRICRLAVGACVLAVQDAGIEGGPGLGLVVGSEHGDFTSSRDFAQGFLRHGPPGLSPMLFPNTVMNTMAAVAAIVIGAKAPSVTVNQATLAGDLALARGARLILDGRAEAVVAGGVDALFQEVYRRLAEMGALSPMGGGAPEGCRPFAGDHNGPVLGEGATFLVLEELTAARARGAPIIAEMLDAAWGNVPTAPHTARPRRIDRDSPAARLVRGCAHRRVTGCYGAGNGDPGVDDWERALLGRDLGERRDLLPPRSLAPLFGQHGGLGALRVGAAALDAERTAEAVLVHGIARGGCRTAILVGPVS
jgi:3-oxoacyl-[acyl-carrier-protein] synthase II